MNTLVKSREVSVGSVPMEHEIVTTTARAVKTEVVAHPSGRFDRVGIGLWFGGAAFGIAGGIIGACMPYHHPVAVAMSVIWWGIYIGCLGAGLGALFASLVSPDPVASPLKECSSFVHTPAARKTEQQTRSTHGH